MLFRFRKRAKYFEAPATDIDFQNNVVTCVDPNKPADDPSRSVPPEAWGFFFG